MCVTGVEQGYYLLRWGWTLQRLGIERQHGLELTEKALEIGQEQDQQLKLQALNNMALVYRGIGQPQQSLKLYEQALPIRREAGDRATDVYNEASSWLENNSVPAIFAVGAVAVVGLLGYLLGRRSFSGSFEERRPY